MKREEYTRTDDTIEILDQRLGSGQIDRVEYERLKEVILSGRSARAVGHTRGLSRSGLTILIVLGVVLAFAVTSIALAYGPWRSADGGIWPWGNRGGMGGGMGGFGASEVVIVNYAYGPQEMTVSAGTSVTWVNMDPVMHTVTFGEHGDAHGNEIGIDSGPMYHMDAWSYTFDEIGIYEYHCDPHPYMTGNVIVES